MLQYMLLVKYDGWLLGQSFWQMEAFNYNMNDGNMT